MIDFCIKYHNLSLFEVTWFSKQTKNSSLYVINLFIYYLIFDLYTLNSMWLVLKYKLLFESLQVRHNIYFCNSSNFVVLRACWFNLKNKQKILRRLYSHRIKKSKIEIFICFFNKQSKKMSIKIIFTKKKRIK